MKIGIVSIHSAHNYGSVLQAYALQKELLKFTSDVTMINYRPHYLEKLYQLFSISIYKEYNGLWNKLIHLGYRIVRFNNRYQKYKKFEQFIESNNHLTKRYTNDDELKEEKDKYDIIFCGSDQIWNTDITNGFDKAYYLAFTGEKTVRASYAASIGRDKIDPRFEKNYHQYIKQFDFISLREKSSKNVIKEYTHKHISVNIDPTLLLEKKDWLKLCKESKMNISYSYLLVYILEENQEMIKIVDQISQYLKLPVISISKKKRFKNERNFSSAGPFDFLKLVSQAEFVVTNSFHGTVFSLLFEKKNCVIPHQRTGNRMIDLMATVGLTNRVIRKVSLLNINEITKEIDYDKVKKKIDQQRIKSEEYIREVVNYAKEK